MTRIGVAKHLQLLEANGLVVTKRQGREKLHFLNPLPIRLIHDRWIDKFTQGWAAGLADLKHDLERTVEKVFEIYIRTTPEQLWHAITDSETRSKYRFGALIQCDWSPGSRFEMSADATTSSCSARVRSSRSIHPVAWSRPCGRCGETT